MCEEQWQKRGLKQSSRQAEAAKMLRSASPARRGWQTRTVAPGRGGYAEVASHKTRCRQPTALLWRLPRRSWALACSPMPPIDPTGCLDTMCKPLLGHDDAESFIMRYQHHLSREESEPRLADQLSFPSFYSKAMLPILYWVMVPGRLHV
jgi:hypothetical protein